jgi:hypothetical protein
MGKDKTEVKYISEFTNFKFVCLIKYLQKWYRYFYSTNEISAEKIEFSAEVITNIHIGTKYVKLTGGGVDTLISENFQFSIVCRDKVISKITCHSPIVGKNWLKVKY